MEDLRLLLKIAVEGGLSEEHRDQANRIVDAVCDALDAGGDADAIADAASTEVNIPLKHVESALLNAETMLGGGA